MKIFPAFDNIYNYQLSGKKYILVSSRCNNVSAKKKDTRAGELKFINLHHLINNFLDQSIRKMFCLIMKTEALVTMYQSKTNDRCGCVRKVILGLCSMSAFEFKQICLSGYFDSIHTISYSKNDHLSE